MIYALFSNLWRRLDWTLIQVTAGMNCFNCSPYVNTSLLLLSQFLALVVIGLEQAITVSSVKY